MKSEPPASMHEIDIREVNRGRYTVTYQSEVLLDCSTDPEWDAARKLVARGHTGTLRTRRAGSDVVGFELSLEQAAQLMTNGTAGFRAFEPKVVENLRPKDAA